jgi:hypothetical protein
MEKGSAIMQCSKCQRTSWISNMYRVFPPIRIIVRHFTCACGHVWHVTHTGQEVECTCREWGRILTYQAGRTRL